MNPPSRFCAYCRRHKDDIGFKVVIHFKTMSKRLQCPSCQENRAKPRHELERLAKAEAEARKLATSEAMKRSLAEREETKRKYHEDPGN